MSSFSTGNLYFGTSDCNILKTTGPQLHSVIIILFSQLKCFRWLDLCLTGNLFYRPPSPFSPFSPSSTSLHNVLPVAAPPWRVRVLFSEILDWTDKHNLNNSFLVSCLQSLWAHAQNTAPALSTWGIKIIRGINLISENINNIQLLVRTKTTWTMEFNSVKTRPVERRKKLSIVHELRAQCLRVLSTVKIIVMWFL